MGVALALGLVVVGGAALVSSMNSEAMGPANAAVRPDDSTTTMAGAVEKDRTVYATFRFVRKVEVYAAGPGNTPVYWKGHFTKGEERDVLWPDVDVTIGDSAAVRVQVDGKALKLPAGKVTISFVEGAPEARSVGE